MRVISKRRLREFWQVHPNAKAPLEAWHRVVASKDLSWARFLDVRETYRSADLVGACVVFNVGGGNYRLIAKIDYLRFTVFVKAVLTHPEYDRGNWKAACGCI